MIDRLRSVALLALYQLTVTMGILLLPVAMIARHVGIRLPLHRLVEWTGEAYRSRSR